MQSNPLSIRIADGYEIDLRRLLVSRLLITSSSGYGKIWLLRRLFEQVAFYVQIKKSGIDRVSLGKILEMEITGGTFQTYLGTLRRLNLVRESPGHVFRPAPILIGAE